MTRFNRMLHIDRERMTFTAQAGLQLIDASRALRAQNLQLMTNIEIGNMTLGSAACCHSKDALDGIEFGQVSSYITRIKWVTPSGELQQASEDANPELLYLIRSSYGLCGIIYEVTFRIKPMEAAQLIYLPRPVKDLTEKEVAGIIDRSEGLICWTVGHTAIFQTKKRTAKTGPFGFLMAAGRHRMWNHTAAYFGRAIQLYVPGAPLENLALNGWLGVTKLLYDFLHITGGLSLYDPDKTVDYHTTPAASKYAFTFWAFPRDQWLTSLREYLDFADAHFKRYGFRCNMPLGSYHIRRDTHSILSYTHEGEIFSIDPIHAYTDKPAWDRFLQEFNEFSFKRNGIPLLNQSPFVTRAHVEAAYGPRWLQFSEWVQSMDPQGRMLNPFFRELLSTSATRAASTVS